MCLKKEAPQAQPGDGIRSLKSTMLFRTVNYELYVKPNLFIMGFGLVAFLGCTGYIAYMRSKFDGLGYYPAIKEDGHEEYLKKKSKWD
ncbi:PREDICTED: small integral membrane protein 8 [Nicrophorus vespilloides]|uniref:Small integral membrane protein 8 n=1 Tax=Nicrophorus vespilloides TaxID=110193 RepID=A0ABM1M0A8_NICVS|nr:PREDICTED: small integral membrane protein 8 [Nicrophorus vespilloides]